MARQRLGPLLVERPDLAREWVWELNLPDTPAYVPLWATEKYAWRCPNCDHVYFTTPHSRHYYDSGCPPCGRRRAGEKARRRQAK